MPLKFYIPHRQPHETLVYLLRRHFVIITFKLFFWGIVAVMPFPLLYMLERITPELMSQPFIEALATVFLSLYYLFVWLFAFHTFIDYYLDVWIVTNERIINMEQHGLFSRVVSEQNLYRVQDITAEMKGMIPTFLNYGNVHVQTAGEQQRFIFKQVSDPSGIAQKITKMVEDKKHQHELEEKKALQQQ